MQTNKQKKQSKNNYRHNVRFTEEEYKHALEISKESEKSIPFLLKKSFFRGQHKPLFNEDDTDRLLSEMRRIGSNVNQIARKINGGLYEGWYPELVDFSKSFDALYKFLKLQRQ